MVGSGPNNVSLLGLTQKLPILHMGVAASSRSLPTALSHQNSFQRVSSGWLKALAYCGLLPEGEEADTAFMHLGPGGQILLQRGGGATALMASPALARDLVS